MWKKFSRTEIYWPYRGGWLSNLSLDPVSTKSAEMFFLQLSLHLQGNVWWCVAYLQAWLQNRHSQGRTWWFFYTLILAVLPFFPIHLQRNWLHSKVCCRNGENVFFFPHYRTDDCNTWNIKYITYCSITNVNSSSTVLKLVISVDKTAHKLPMYPNPLNLLFLHQITSWPVSLHP